MSFWQLGNTSVRSAIRIKDGLTALSASTIQGNIRGVDGDIAFRHLLGESGIVSLGEDATNSVGRKWRAAMGKLGFIYPEVKRLWGFTQQDLGQLDMITPAGWNLVRAETVAAMQECYLRAMATPLSPIDNVHTFSPLCWTLAILLELEHRGEEPAVNFIEMARIVQTTNPIEFAVNNPAQEPQPGQECSSISFACTSVIEPFSSAPGASNARVSAMRPPATRPGSVGPR